MAIKLTRELAEAHIGHQVIHRLRAGVGTPCLPAKLLEVINGDTVLILPNGHGKPEKVRMRDCKLTTKSFRTGQGALDLEALSASGAGDLYEAGERSLTQMAAEVRQGRPSPAALAASSQSIIAACKEWESHRAHGFMLRLAVENGMPMRLRYLLNPPPDFSYAMGDVIMVGEEWEPEIELVTADQRRITRSLLSCAFYITDNMTPGFAAWWESVHAKPKRVQAPVPVAPVIAPPPVVRIQPVIVQPPAPPPKPVVPELATKWLIVRRNARLVYRQQPRGWIPLSLDTLDTTAHYEDAAQAKRAAGGAKNNRTGTLRSRIASDLPQTITYARARSLAVWCDRQREAEAEAKAKAEQEAREAEERAAMAEAEAQARELEAQAERLRQAARQRLLIRR